MTLREVMAARFAMQQPLQIPAAPWKVASVAPPPDLSAVLRDRLTRPRFIALGAGLLAVSDHVEPGVKLVRDRNGDGIVP